MKKWRIVLNTGEVRKHNAFLRFIAKGTESDDLAELIIASMIHTRPGRNSDKVTLKGA